MSSNAVVWIVLLLLQASLSAAQGAAANVTCTPTGFIRDGINLTAALINPSKTVSGGVNSSGCNIGIYYGPGAKGAVYRATIFGANYFGVVNDGGNVNVTYSRIHDIGENPLNGSQHGVGIYFADESGAKGKLQNNLIWNYQKGGIVVNGSSDSARINDNSVLGLGPVNFIAQNGIQIGFGASGSIRGNTVSGNSYSGSNFAISTGILVVGGACFGGPITVKIRVHGNTVVGSDGGIDFSNLDNDGNGNCVPTLNQTQDVASGNTVDNALVNNISGHGAGAGYQAGIADQGNDDSIVNNAICGAGYTPVSTPPPFLYFIDTTNTIDPDLSGNISCLEGSPSTRVMESASVARANAVTKLHPEQPFR